MNRRDFIKGLSCLAASTAMPGCAGESLFSRTEPANRPNFVFFLADDLGWSELSCFGSDFYETPNIDRLAAEGMLFSDAYAASPVCSPTRASIMTGKHPARINLTTWIGNKQKPTPYVDRMKLEEFTIAEALKQAGYETCHVGKWHLAPRGAEDVADFYPQHQGFDINIAGNHWGAPGTYFYPYEARGRVLANMPPGGHEGEYLTDRLTDEAIDFIKAEREKPFMLNFSYYTVHTPIEAKERLIEKYKAKLEKLGLVNATRFKKVYGDYKTRLTQDHAVYAAMIETLDQSVGRVMDTLRELRIEDNTIVFFMSDNGGLSTIGREGPASNVPLRSGKGWVYEGGIREPMIVKWPGVTEAGSECENPVISMDFYPTMLEMAGLDAIPQQHIDGVSLVPLLKQERSLNREAIYWHFPHYHGSGSRPSGAVRAGDYKLVEWYENGRIELYDLSKDIGEQVNLASRMPEKAAQLKKMLHRWRKSVGARMPSGKPTHDFDQWQKQFFDSD